jgi:fluoride exporter
VSTSERAAPVDPDVDPQLPAQGRTRAIDPAVLAVIAVGGIAGSEARFALERWAPAGDGAWPAATFVINLSGSFLLGALMVVLTELTSPHRLLRPFLGVGVLGGYTTFSTAMVEVPGLVRAGRLPVAIAYLLGTAIAALLAAALGAAAARSTAGGLRRVRRGLR